MGSTGFIVFVNAGRWYYTARTKGIDILCRSTAAFPFGWESLAGPLYCMESGANFCTHQHKVIISGFTHLDRYRYEQP